MHLCVVSTLFLISMLVPAHIVDAQTTPASASYSQGWNMVGGPPGTTFSPADALLSYGPTGYVTATGALGGPCSGYWAEYASPTTIPLSTPEAQSSQSCPLQLGWNLLGNPFSEAALLPSGQIAYHWNPQTAKYDLVAAIPIGAAVWIYSDAPGSLTLTPLAQTGSGITITGLSNHGPYQVHVGDSVTLTLPPSESFVVDAPAELLQLETSGADANSKFWRWRALAAGTAFITLSPTCRLATPPCGAPSMAIWIEILP